MTPTTPRKPGQGRKPPGHVYPERVTVPITRAQREWLDTEATERGVTIAEVIRALIEQARNG